MPQRILRTLIKRSTGCALALLFVGQPVWAGDILVHLQGKQAIGTVHLALVSADQKHWPEQLLHAVHSDESVLRLRDIPPGRYAIQVYQDSNGNGLLDLSPRGIPLEPIGFSGNPSLFTGKPSPLKCLFEHGTTDTELNIRLNNPKAKPKR